jgi:hypothetical protein
MRTLKSAVFSVLWLAFLFLPALSASADEPEGITVSGTGEVSGKPNLIELRARVAGSAELASDAMVKYTDHRRRTLAAIQQLKIKDLKTELGGVSVSYAGDESGLAQVEALGAGAPVSVHPPLGFSSVVKLALSGIQDMPEDKVLEIVSQIVDKLRTNKWCSCNRMTPMHSLTMAKRTLLRHSRSSLSFSMMPTNCASKLIKRHSPPHAPMQSDWPSWPV